MQHSLFFIDNDADTVATVQAHLPQNVWDVTATTQAKKARSIFKATGFDFYLFDVLLHPNGAEIDNASPVNTENGDELAGDLRTDKRLNYTPTAPIVFMTQLALESDVTRANGGRKWSRHFDNYMVPRIHDMDELSNVLLDIMKTHHAEVGKPPVKPKSLKLPLKDLVKPFKKQVLPRDECIVLRNEFLSLVDQLQKASARAASLIDPILQSPTLGGAARAAQLDAVEGAKTAAELVQRSASALSSLADRLK